MRLRIETTTSDSGGQYSLRIDTGSHERALMNFPFDDSMDSRENALTMATAAAYCVNEAVTHIRNTIGAQLPGPDITALWTAFGMEMERRNQ